MKKQTPWAHKEVQQCGSCCFRNGLLYLRPPWWAWPWCRNLSAQKSALFNVLYWEKVWEEHLKDEQTGHVSNSTAPLSVLLASYYVDIADEIKPGVSATRLIWKAAIIFWTSLGQFLSHIEDCWEWNMSFSTLNYGLSTGAQELLGVCMIVLSFSWD